MNKIDYDNIKKEIASRTVKFKEGGELSIEYIQRQDLSTLREMLKAYDEKTKNSVEDMLKKQVDRMFDTYGISEDNMIVFDCTRWVEWERELDSGCHVTEIEFDECKSDIIKPVLGCDTDLKYWDDLGVLTSLLDKLKCPPAYKYFEHREEVNEEWYGCLAITRNYKVVPFVIRDDGYFTDTEGFSRILDDVSKMDPEQYFMYDERHMTY